MSDFTQENMSLELEIAKTQQILMRETHHNWREWMKILPTFSFPANYVVKIIPPFAGAIIRFVVGLAENKDASVSVYLDGYNELGLWQTELTGDPYKDAYWEIYPDVDGENARFAFDDTKALFDAIAKSLGAQNE